jgi:hypothetical protein
MDYSNILLTTIIMLPNTILINISSEHVYFMENRTHALDRLTSTQLLLTYYLRILGGRRRGRRGGEAGVHYSAK